MDVPSTRQVAAFQSHAPVLLTIVTRAPVLKHKWRAIRPAAVWAGGDGGIRTLDTLFKVCSFSKRVPSAARPRLHAPDMPDDAVACKSGSIGYRERLIPLFIMHGKTVKETVAGLEQRPSSALLQESQPGIAFLDSCCPWPKSERMGRDDAKMQRSNPRPQIFRILFVFQVLDHLSHKSVSDFCATVIWKRSNPSRERAGLCCLCRNVR